MTQIFLHQFHNLKNKHTVLVLSICETSAKISVDLCLNKKTESKILPVQLIIKTVFFYLLKFSAKKPNIDL